MKEVKLMMDNSNNMVFEYGKRGEYVFYALLNEFLMGKVIGYLMMGDSIIGWNDSEGSFNGMEWKDIVGWIDKGGMAEDDRYWGCSPFDISYWD
jgi:hypothetical protein